MFNMSIKREKAGLYTITGSNGTVYAVKFGNIWVMSDGDCIEMEFPTLGELKAYYKNYL